MQVDFDDQVFDKALYTRKSSSYLLYLCINALIRYACMHSTNIFVYAFPYDAFKEAFIYAYIHTTMPYSMHSFISSMHSWCILVCIPLCIRSLCILLCKHNLLLLYMHSTMHFIMHSTMHFIVCIPLCIPSTMQSIIFIGIQLTFHSCIQLCID